MNYLTYLFSRVLFRGSSKYSSSIEVVESFGNQKLLVNGIVQTGTYPQLLFGEGIKKLALWHSGVFRNILVLGIGGGDIFRILHRLYPNVHVTGVDIDAEILRVAKEFFHIHEIPNTRYVISDANAFLRREKSKQSCFDSVIIDIYVGNVVPDFILLASFFRNVQRVLRPNGSVMFNYFSYKGQTTKKQEILVLLRKIYSDVDMVTNRRNIFYYCRV